MEFDEPLEGDPENSLETSFGRRYDLFRIETARENIVTATG